MRIERCLFTAIYCLLHGWGWGGTGARATLASWQHHTPQHQHLLCSCKKLAHQHLYVSNGRGGREPNKVIYTVYHHVPGKPGALCQWEYHSSSLLSQEPAQASVKILYVNQLTSYLLSYLFYFWHSHHLFRHNYPKCVRKHKDGHPGLLPSLHAWFIKCQVNATTLIKYSMLHVSL